MEASILLLCTTYPDRNQSHNPKPWSQPWLELDWTGAGPDLSRTRPDWSRTRAGLEPDRTGLDQTGLDL